MKAESDVQSEVSQNYSHLDWVGMTLIQTSVQLAYSQESKICVPAFLDLGVDLAANNRGIHMSRLYQLHQNYILNQNISDTQFSLFAEKCLQSQNGLSEFFSMKLKFVLPIKTMSLVSQLPGFRNYPIEIILELNQKQKNFWIQFAVLYSSTCPQSASLAFEVLTDKGLQAERLPATPHAQRSRAVVNLQVAELNQSVIELMIGEVEQSLGTPVQTTVKKADELKFAELNAENLMFCEDATRKVISKLKQNDHVLGASVLCEHQESLHPHNATSLSQFNYKPPLKIQFG